MKPPLVSGSSAKVEAIRKIAGPGKRVCFVSGNFNVVHPGHLRLLRFANEVADFLVVGVNPDDTSGVTVPAAERLENMRSIKTVDHSVLLTEPVADFIAELKPAVVVKGKEFEGGENPEAAAVASYGGKLLFSSGEMRFASIAQLHRDYLNPNFSSIRKPTGYALRHKFEFADLTQNLAKLASIRVLVIGDLIVDDYITCDPIGMSQEDPTIVVTPIETETFVGGAGVVAAHARGLGANVTFISVTGDDEAATIANDWLVTRQIATHTFRDDTRPTTRKQRFRASGKTLLRVNHLRQHPITRALAENMLRLIKSQLEHTDLLLFSDFNYGCLPQSFVDAIVEHAKSLGVMMGADSQASSQMADISRFKDMTLVTPTEREARLAVRDSQAGLAVLAEQLSTAARAENVLITLGSEGMLIYAKQNGRYVTDRLPAFNTAPKDVAGAGDSMFTCASLAMCAGVDVWQAAYLGSIAAACQVGRVGNAPLTLDILRTEISANDSSIEELEFQR